MSSQPGLITAVCLLSGGLMATLLSGCDASDAGPTVPAVPPRTIAQPDGAPAIVSRQEVINMATGRVLPKTFDDLKFDIEPDAPFERAMLTEEIEQLANKRIEIRGYILPGFHDKLREFVLVRDNQECCFGPGAALYDCVLVEMVPGKVADFSTRPVTVEGLFRIEPLDIGGVTRAVFRMTADKVQ